MASCGHCAIETSGLDAWSGDGWERAGGNDLLGAIHVPIGVPISDYLAVGLPPLPAPLRCIDPHGLTLGLSAREQCVRVHSPS